MNSQTLRFRQREWFVANGFLDESAANATSANFHSLVGAISLSDTDSLQVRAKLTTSFASDFCTDTAEILRFTASLNGVSHLRALATNFTNASHDESRYENSI